MIAFRIGSECPLIERAGCEWLLDHIIKFARWQHPRIRGFSTTMRYINRHYLSIIIMGRRSRFAVSGSWHHLGHLFYIILAHVRLKYLTDKCYTYRRHDK